MEERDTEEEVRDELDDAHAQGEEWACWSLFFNDLDLYHVVAVAEGLFTCVCSGWPSIGAEGSGR